MKDFWKKLGEQIKIFFVKLWADLWPLLKTACVVGFNWVINWIKNYFGFKKFEKEEAIKNAKNNKFNVEPTLTKKEWIQKYGYQNCWAKSHNKYKKEN